MSKAKRAKRQSKHPVAIFEVQIKGHVGVLTFVKWMRARKPLVRAHIHAYREDWPGDNVLKEVQ